MKFYYLNNNQQSNGDYEVHTKFCTYFPLDYVELGQHNNCNDAIKIAKKIYSQVNGCFYCCRECHTS